MSGVFVVPTLGDRVPLSNVHRVLFRFGGPMACLDHPPDHARRAALMAEFGHKACNCIAVFDWALRHLRGETPEARLGPIFSSQLAATAEATRSLPAGAVKAYRRWRRRHWAELVRLGGVPDTVPRAARGDGLGLRLAEALKARGHYAKTRLNGATLEVSLGTRLKTVRVDLSLQSRTKRALERWSVRVFDPDEEFRDWTADVTLWWASEPQSSRPKGTLGSANRPVGEAFAVQLIETLVFVAASAAGGGKWARRPSPSPGAGRPEKTPTPSSSAAAGP